MLRWRIQGMAGWAVASPARLWTDRDSAGPQFIEVFLEKGGMISRPWHLSARPAKGLGEERVRRGLGGGESFRKSSLWIHLMVPLAAHPDPAARGGCRHFSIISSSGW